MSVALEARQILGELRPPSEIVRRRMVALRRRVRQELLLEGLAWTLTGCCALVAGTLLIDWLFRIGLAARLAILIPAMLAVAAISRQKLVRPLRLRLQLLDLAAVLDRTQPGFSQSVATVFELPELIDGRVQASPGMVRAAVLENARALAAADWSGCFDWQRKARFSALLAAAVMIPSFFTLWTPHIARLWVARWLQGSQMRWPQRNYLSLVGAEPGKPLLVPRGESITLQLEANPRFARDEEEGIWRLPGRTESWLATSDRPPACETPDQVSVMWKPAAAPARQAILTRIGETRFRCELPPVMELLSLQVRGGDDWWGPIEIKPLDRPVLESLTLVARSPGKSEPQTFDGSQSQLLFLPRTELELQIVAREPLAEATLNATSGAAPTLERIDDRTHRTRWSMRETLSLEINLVGLEGGLRSKPYFLSVGLLVDRPPRVTLQSSGVGRRITPQARVPLVLRALDDFGLTSWRFETEHLPAGESAMPTQSGRKDLPSPLRPGEEPGLEGDHSDTFAAAELSLLPGATLKLRGAAVDNCAEGAQTGVSRWLLFQVVTPEELFYEILMRQRAQRARFRQSYEATLAQVEALTGEIGREQAAAVLRKHQAIARQVAEVARQLSATHEELTLNELGSPAARELMKTRILDPLARLAAQLLVEQRGRLEALADEPLESRQIEAAEAERQIAGEMDAILKQMSQWESFVDVVNQLKQIIKLQTGVLETTEEERKKKTNSVFDD